MAPVAIKFVVTFTSQDLKYSAETLLTKNEAKYSKWLCAPKERSGVLEGVFQLERACVISGIDIGNAGSANIQFLVGKSSWPMSKDYVCLVPVTTLMKPRDIRDGLNKHGVRMFKEADFNEDAAKEKWDRIKVRLTQHLKKDKPFGLAMMRIKAEDEEMDTLKKTPQAVKQSTEERRQYNITAKNNRFASPSWKSASDFQRHFMKDMAEPERNIDAETVLKGKLLDLAGTAENGTNHEDSLSRTAKIVMAANGLTTPKYVKSPIVSQSGSSKKKRPPSFAEEVTAFIKKIDPSSLDVENLTLADLRHKLEKLKCRKLSKEEKKYFFEKIQEYLESVFSGEEKGETCKTPAKQSRVMNCDTPKITPGLFTVTKTTPKSTPTIPKTLQTTPSVKRTQKNSPTVSKSLFDKRHSVGTTVYFGGKSFPISPPSQDVRSPQQSHRNIVNDLFPTAGSPSYQAALRRQEQSYEDNGHKQDPTAGSLEFLSHVRRQESSSQTASKTPQSNTKPRRKRKAAPVTPDTNDVWLTATPGEVSQVVNISDEEEECTRNSVPRRRAVSTAKHRKMPEVIDLTPKSSKAKAVAKKRKVLPSTLTSPRVAPGVKRNTVMNNPSMYESQEQPENQSPPARQPSPVRTQSFDTDPSIIECPLCKDSFPFNQIELHAAVCESSGYACPNTSSSSLTDHDVLTVDGVACPICQQPFPVLEIEAHADHCAWTAYS
ncbi:uncharacterized protein LOC135483062 [Lineus longissimus]|uniref:uncharacterized protein LOC135483062 n=1 Tax=Lineus longissimus TaxID=88925 RepID=UPI00315C7434